MDSEALAAVARQEGLILHEVGGPFCMFDVDTHYINASARTRYTCRACRLYAALCEVALAKAIQPEPFLTLPAERL